MCTNNRKVIKTHENLQKPKATSLIAYFVQPTGWRHVNLHILETGMLRFCHSAIFAWKVTKTICLWSNYLATHFLTNTNLAKHSIHQKALWINPPMVLVLRSSLVISFFVSNVTSSVMGSEIHTERPVSGCTTEVPPATVIMTDGFHKLKS